MKKKKLTLEELKIESFLTSESSLRNQTPHLHGGSGYPIAESDFCTPRCPQWLLDQIAKETAIVSYKIREVSQASMKVSNFSLGVSKSVINFSMKVSVTPLTLSATNIYYNNNSIAMYGDTISDNLV